MTTPRSYAGLSLAERKAQRRQRFLDAGQEVFGTVGYAKASISALCAQATRALARRVTAPPREGTTSPTE